MTSAAAKKRAGPAVVAALLCALVASLIVAVAPAAAEEGDSAPIRPFSGLSFPDITGPTAPEEYPFQYGTLSPELTLRQVDGQTIKAEYVKYGVESFSIKAEPAHAADGATVPTSVRLSEDEEGFVITEVVRFRAGNPVAGGAPFAYPISGGKGWEGGYFVKGFEMNEPKPPASAAPTPPVAPPCTVPSLRDLSLRAAKTRLRAAHCSIGQVHLASTATTGKGKVVKQFRAAGTELPAGAAVAVKLGSGH